MGKHNVVSGILVLVVFLMIAISTFLVVNYVTGVLTAAVAFASTDQMAKLVACGVTPPAELFKLQADIPTLLLPAIYVGFPGLMAIIAVLMFVSGYYFGPGAEERNSSETTKTSSPNAEKTRTQKPSKREEE